MTVLLAPPNYFKRSNALANAYWQKIDATVTDNVAAGEMASPISSLAVSKIVEGNAVASAHAIRALGGGNDQPVQQGEAAQMVFYLRGGGALGGTRRLLALFDDATGSYAVFNPRTGLVDQTQANVSYTRMTAVGSWYRCVLVVTNINSMSVCSSFFELDNGANGAGVSNNYNGDGVSGVYIAGLTATYGPLEVTETVQTGAAFVTGSYRGLP